MGTNVAVKYSAPTLTQLMKTRRQYSKTRSHSPQEFCSLYYGIQPCDKQDSSNIGYNEKSMCAVVVHTKIRRFVQAVLNYG